MLESAAYPKSKSEAWITVSRCALGLALFTLPLGLAQGQTTTTNPQDVPQQQAPGTNNPDVSKQRRPAPAQPGHNSSDTNSADVPHQQPGTNSPDVAKQRSDNNGTSTDSGSGSDKKQTGSHHKGKRKSTSGT